MGSSTRSGVTSIDCALRPALHSQEGRHTTVWVSWRYSVFKPDFDNPAQVAGGPEADTPNGFRISQMSMSAARFFAAHPRAHPFAHLRIRTRSSPSEEPLRTHATSMSLFGIRALPYRQMARSIENPQEPSGLPAFPIRRLRVPGHHPPRSDGGPEHDPARNDQ
jgi:hypothetical protein